MSAHLADPSIPLDLRLAVSNAALAYAESLLEVEMQRKLYARSEKGPEQRAQLRRAYAHNSFEALEDAIAAVKPHL